ncbi:unnamed protein product, partial [Staurois parvus]
MGPQVLGDHGAPVSLPTLKAHPKKPIKGTRGISWGPLLTPGPWAMPVCSNGQSAPGFIRAELDTVPISTQHFIHPSATGVGIFFFSLLIFTILFYFLF